uniref:T-cell surface glycoprotein CD3 epsilon chain n=1 Tax=Sus scrofa TaxID=9823 RepID=A0A4X1STZ7_PIG
MPSGNLWKVLGLCLLSVGAWGQEDIERPAFKVSISGDKVELTCPEDPESEKMTWKRNDMQIYESYDNYMLLESFSEVENSGYYTCTVGEKTSHRLYLKARVCENCVEVDLMAVVTIIVVDICITLGLLMVVYYYSKSRKAKAMPVTRGAGAGGRPRGQNRERPPPVPNPDYEVTGMGGRGLSRGEKGSVHLASQTLQSPSLGASGQPTHACLC